MSEEKGQIMKLIKIEDLVAEQDEDPGVDYSTEYQKQTGKDFETGKYFTQ